MQNSSDVIGFADQSIEGVEVFFDQQGAKTTDGVDVLVEHIEHVFAVLLKNGYPGVGIAFGQAHRAAETAAGQFKNSRFLPSAHEQEWAQRSGVAIRTWAVLEALHSANGRLAWTTFAEVAERDGRLVETGETWTLEADMLLKAIGQTFDASGTPGIELRDGRIITDADGRTSMPKVWAGGDCRFGGRDLTVEAVQHGKLAAESIDRALRQGASAAPAPATPAGAAAARHAS